MVLEYKFEYLSNNNTLIKFLDVILKDDNLPYEIFRDGNFIFLYIEGEEEELINNSNKLAQQIPMSIFLKNYTLEVVPRIEKKDYIQKKDYFNLPYCSNCVANIENKELTNFYNPFFNCNICGTTCDVPTLKFLHNNNEIKFNDYKDLFEIVASKINEDTKVKIKTRSGEYVFYKTKKLQSEDERLLCVNSNSLSKLAVTAKAKTVALFSIEKPSIDFYLNSIYKSNNDITFDTVNIKAPFDLTLYLLSKELESLNIDFLTYEKSEDFDYELTFDEEIEKICTPDIAINDGKVLVLENKNYDKKLDEVYSKFDDMSKSQLMVLIEENDLYEKSILNIFTSFTANDNICLYSKKIDGVIDILNYNVPSTISSIFEEIEKEESGKRLLSNYKEKFPEAFETAVNYQNKDNEKSSIYALWNLASIVLGFTTNITDKNILLDNAQKAVLPKGPRVDYKLKDSDKIFNREFDVSKFIKSGISFKLAGVDDKTLSLGYVESFTYFIANIIDDVNNEFELDGASLCGDFIADELVYKLVNKAITSNFNLYYNKDFPIQL